MRNTRTAKSDVENLISLHNELAADLCQPEFEPGNSENTVNQCHKDASQGNCVWIFSTYNIHLSTYNYTPFTQP